ncbi:GntR family transcriptional regulator [Streptomyces sp. NPDC002537]
MRSEPVRQRAVSKYLRVADDVLAQIRAGGLLPGQRVPSESELMARYGVSVGTVRRAMAEIRASGLVETLHGKGSYVRVRPPVRRKSSDRFRCSHGTEGRAVCPVEAEPAGGAVKVSVLYAGPVAAPPDIADRLGVPPGSQVLARRYLYFSDGTPTEEATSYIPWDVTGKVPGLLAGNPGPDDGTHVCPEGHGREFTGFVDTVRARLAAKDECAMLGLSPGAPVMLLTREVVSREGRIVEVCESVMAADRFVLEYRVPMADWPSE